MNKILITSNSPYDNNGISSVIDNLHFALKNENISVDYVFTNTHKSNKYLFQQKKTKVFLLKSRTKMVWAYVLELCKIIKNGNYDIIHVHGNSCTMVLELFVAWLFGIKVRIAHVHSTNCKYKIFNIIFRPLFKRMVTHGIACSEAAGEWIFKKDIKYSILLNSIHGEKYRYSQSERENIRCEFGLKNELAVVCVGYLAYPKNQTFLLDILNEIRDSKVKLFFIGSGKDKELLQEKIVELKLQSQVCFLGERNDVPRLLNAFDILVVPSVFEGFSIVALEGQASGLKVICSTGVPKDCKFTDNILYIPLEEKDRWVDEILKHYPTNRTDCVDALNQSKYSILNVKKTLVDIYGLLVV